MDLDDILFNFFGWTYLVAWTALYYPQIYLNFKNKSCTGVSRIYVFYNTFGFTCYTIYNVTRKLIQDANGLPPAVSYHDVIFAIHSLICCTCLCFQLRWYEHGNETISKFDWSMLFVLIFITIIAFGLSALGVIDWFTTDGFSCEADCSPMRQFSFIQILGHVKVVVTLLKYPAQIRLNFLRKSTQGLAVSTYMLDFTGGSCSILQNIVHALLKSDMEYILGNIPKLGLGSISLSYDIVILLQIWYYAREKPIYVKVSSAEADDFMEFDWNDPDTRDTVDNDIEMATIGLQFKDRELTKDSNNSGAVKVNTRLRGT
eukprot:GEMP01039462.1.p1 GENE.GEMP01039462.1~~GEMP01039462.1.p1  ORF type:complete len:316 (+),score=9.28 GEMP01039462.1:182-1129(+)